MADHQQVEAEAKEQPIARVTSEIAQLVIIVDHGENSQPEEPGLVIEELNNSGDEYSTPQEKATATVLRRPKEPPAIQAIPQAQATSSTAEEATALTPSYPKSESSETETSVYEEAEENAEEAWPAVLEWLQKARDLNTQAKNCLEEASAQLEYFLETHGEEGLALAKKDRDWPSLIKQACGMRDAGRQWYNRDKERRAIEEEERKAQEQIARFQKEAERIAQDLQRQKNAVTMKKRLLNNQPAVPDKPKLCYVCKLPGVDRGRECPNRLNHKPFLQKMKERENRKK